MTGGLSPASCNQQLLLVSAELGLALRLTEEHPGAWPVSCRALRGRGGWRMLQHMGASAASAPLPPAATLYLPGRAGDQDPSQLQCGHGAGHILTCSSSVEGLGCCLHHVLCFSSK